MEYDQAYQLKLDSASGAKSSEPGLPSGFHRLAPVQEAQLEPSAPPPSPLAPGDGSDPSLFEPCHFNPSHTPSAPQPSPRRPRSAASILQVTVEQLNGLPSACPIVQRPVVRAHIVDATTGGYLPSTAERAGQVLDAATQHTQLQQTGHDTLVSTYPTSHGSEAPPHVTVLSHVPPTQTQEGKSTIANGGGGFIWNEALRIDAAFRDALLSDNSATLLLFEVLQHPPSASTWAQHRPAFVGGVQRLAWAFLDCSHASVRRRLKLTWDATPEEVEDRGSPWVLQLYRWPANLARKADGGSPMCAGAAFEAFQRLQSADASTPKQRLRQLGLMLGPPDVDRIEAGLHVRILPVERPLADEAALAVTVAKAREGVLQTLPAGYGSGWDNYRGEHGEYLPRRRGSSASLTSQEAAAQVVRALSRRPGDACRVPNAIHDRPGRQAGALAQCNCSVVAFSPDGLKLAVAAEQPQHLWRVQVYDVPSSCLIPGHSFPCHVRLVYDLCWSPNGRTLVSASSDFTAKVWHLPSAAASYSRTCPIAPPCVVLSHPSFVYACQFQPRGGTGSDHDECADICLLATGCEDGHVRLWSIDCRKVLREHATSVTRFCPADDAVLATIKNVPAGSRLDAVTALLWDSCAAAGGASGGVPGTLARPATLHQWQHQGQSILFSGSLAGSVSEWLVDSQCVQSEDGTGVVKSRCLVAGACVSSLCSAAMARHLVAVTKDGSITLIHKPSFTLLATITSLPLHNHPLKAALDPSHGRLLAVPTLSGHVLLFDLSPSNLPQHPSTTAASPPSRSQTHISPPALVMAHSAAALSKAPSSCSPGRHMGDAAVYCVAWNPTLHMMVVAGRRMGAGVTLLKCCDSPTDARSPRLFRPLSNKHNRFGSPSKALCGPSAPPAPAHHSREGKATPRQASNAARGTMLRSTARGGLGATISRAHKYDLPDKLEPKHIRTLLRAIRSDLHGKGFLDSDDQLKLTGRI